MLGRGYVWIGVGENLQEGIGSKCLILGQMVVVSMEILQTHLLEAGWHHGHWWDQVDGVETAAVATSG